MARGDIIMRIPVITRVVTYERTIGSFLTDLLIFCAGLSLFYGLLMIVRTWLRPFAPSFELSFHPSALPLYACYSLLRIALAYALSLAFALAYGYAAAYNARAERVMLPLLDILQSIPVLSFLPGVMLFMIALFPHSRMGLELGSILLIFTGQVWNLAFSFYNSLKSIPPELHEAAQTYNFSAWQRFIQLELPYSAIGLVWNSMMSVSGGWFFLMACEMFVLGKRDFRLPGLGSYLQTAASAGDTAALLWGVGTMITVIVLLDQFVWRPVVAWANKFKFEQVESADAPHSKVLNILKRSRGMAYINHKAVAPIGERVDLFFARRQTAGHHAKEKNLPQWKLWFQRACFIIASGLVLYACIHAAFMMAGLTRGEAAEILTGAGATFLRVNAALFLGALWTVPAGVAIGTNPRLSQLMQPLVQIAASIPATAIFPVLLLALVRAGGGLSTASVLLLLLGTQWYILFNVIAGAASIPTDLKESSTLFRFRKVEQWRWLILPCIFPYLITGMVTAAGGAWNASIVAEYFHFKGHILSTTGLGATISHATDTGNFDVLLASTIVMAIMVVTVNRLVWRKLYALADTRFKLET